MPAGRRPPLRLRRAACFHLRHVRSIKWCIAGLGCGLAVVVAARVSLAEAQSRAIYVNPARLDVRIPQQHPYLALIPVDVVRAKERVGRWVWAKRVYDGHLSEADTNIGRPWDKLPNKDDREHWHVASRLFSTGVAYALSGDKKYARWTRDGLLAYADLYPRIPLTNERCILPEVTYAMGSVF